MINKLKAKMNKLLNYKKKIMIYNWILKQLKKKEKEIVINFKLKRNYYKNKYKITKHQFNNWKKIFKIWPQSIKILLINNKQIINNKFNKCNQN